MECISKIAVSNLLAPREVLGFETVHTWNPWKPCAGLLDVPDIFCFRKQRNVGFFLNALLLQLHLLLSIFLSSPQKSFSDLFWTAFPLLHIPPACFCPQLNSILFIHIPFCALYPSLLQIFSPICPHLLSGFKTFT